MQNLKIQFNTHCWTLKTYKYDAWSCGLYKIEQSMIVFEIEYTDKPSAGPMSG